MISRNTKVLLLSIIIVAPVAAVVVSGVRLFSKTITPNFQPTAQNKCEIELNFQNDQARSNTTPLIITALPACCGHGMSSISRSKVMLSIRGSGA